MTSGQFRSPEVQKGPSELPSQQITGKEKTAVGERLDMIASTLNDPNLPGKQRKELMDEYSRTAKELERATAAEEARVQRKSLADQLIPSPNIKFPEQLA